MKRGKKKIPRGDFHRKNGFSLPLDPLQVLTWFFVLLPLVLFFTIQYPLLQKKQSIFWMVLVLCCWVIGIFMFTLATCSDHPVHAISSPDFAYNCRYCGESVPNSAKHCRMCNRCRCGFDHHCRFINNCVTEANYLSFFFGCMFLTSTIYIGLAHVFYSVWYFVGHQDEVLARLSDHLMLRTSRTAFWILFGVTVFLDLGVSIPMTVLTVYHIYFQRRSISTYDYLMSNFTQTPQKLQTFCCTASRHIKVTSN